MTLYEKLRKIQEEMHVPKNLWNDFGGYSYRNAEGILEAFKPFEEKYGVTLMLTDDIVQIGDRFYLKAVAKLYDTEEGSPEPIEAVAWAREPAQKKGLDDSQVTGATSSYARKYALNGLFLLDDNKDADSNESRGKDKITADMLEGLRKQLKEVCVEEGQVLNLFGPKRMEDLTVAQYNTVLKKVEATRKARMPVGDEGEDARAKA